MKPKSQKDIRQKYFRDKEMPHMFCPGCGNGSIMNYMAHAIENQGLDLLNIVFVSGIGCSSRIPSYFKADGIHTTHGRALAFATGIKVANPDLKVIVFSGDGDCMSIGGNHFLHAIRRNIDITLIVSNNYSYGMTGGQLAPTTPKGSKTATSIYGSIEHPIDISRTANLLGAPYVARWSVAHPFQAIRSMEKALSKKGFSLVEMLSPGPVCFGKKNDLGDPVKMWKWYKENTSIYTDKEGKETIEDHIREMDKEMVIGEFADRVRSSFTEEYEKIVERLKCD